MPFLLLLMMCRGADSQCCAYQAELPAEHLVP